MYLLHLGMDHNEATIGQTYYWPNIRDNIHTQINVCKNCEKNKKQSLKYGHLPAKASEAIPWDRLLVDLIGPYKMIRDDH